MEEKNKEIPFITLKELCFKSLFVHFSKDKPIPSVAKYVQKIRRICNEYGVPSDNKLIMNGKFLFLF